MMRKLLGLLLIFISAFTTLFGQCEDLVVNAGNDINVCPGESIVLQGSINGSFNGFGWEPELLVQDPHDLNTTAFSVGTYVLTAYAQDNVNLIQNGDFSNGNASFTSGYIYEANPGLFDQGDYSVHNDPSQFNTGFTDCDDVTGEGLMFLADGAIVPGVDAWCQTIAIDPNTEYYFSFHSSSCLVDASPANYSVSFNGSATANFTDSGNACDWQLNEASWNSNSNNSVTICIRNNNTTGSGNDFVLDDIRLYGSCKKQDEVIVNEVALPLEGDRLYSLSCGITTLELLLTDYPQFGPYTVNWTTSDGNIVTSLQNPPYTATIDAPGTYMAVLVYDDGTTTCEKEIEIIVVETESMLDGFPIEIKPLECAANGILAADGTTLGFEYSWFANPGRISSNPDSIVIDVTSEGTYFLVEYDPITGCRDTTDIIVTANADFPDAVIRTPDTLNCENLGTYILNGTNSVLTPNDTFEWTTINGNFRGNTNSLSVGIADPGEYKLVIIDSITGCSDTAIVEILENFTFPQVAFPDTITIDCEDQSFALFNSQHDMNNFEVIYIWTQNSIAYISDTFPVTNSGQIIVETSNESNGCITIDTIEVSSDANLPSIDFENLQQFNCNNTEIDITIRQVFDPSFSYTWNTNTGNIISSSDSNAILVNEPGLYYLVVTNPSNNCSSIDSIEIDSDYSLPNVQTQDTSYIACGVDSLLLTATTDFSFPDLEWQWTSTDGSILTDPFLEHIYIAGAGNYQFIIFNPNNGCYDTVSQTVIPDINIPELSTSGLDTLDCITSTVRLNALGNSITGSNISYTWSTSNGVITGNTSDAFINISTEGTYRITIIDDSNNCMNTAIFEIPIDTIRPIVSFERDLNIDCANRIIDLESEQAFNNQFLYSWSTLNGVLPNSTNTNEISVEAPGTYNLNVVNPLNGCTNEESIIVQLDTITPQIDIRNPSELNCSRTSIVLDASNSDTGSHIYYTWSSTNSSFFDLSDPLQPIVNQAGSYTLNILNTNNNCQDSSIILITDNKVYPIIDLNQPDSLSCNHQSTSIEAMISNSNSSTLTWTTPNGNITTDPSSNEIIVNEEGLYIINVQDQNSDCVSLDSIYIAGTIAGLSSFELNINNPVCYEDIASYEILNIEGGQGPYEAQLNGTPIPIEQMHNIPPGDYILTISDVNDCLLSDTFRISQANIYPINIGLDLEIEAGDPTRLIPQFGFDTSLISSLIWTPSEALSCDSCFVTDFIARQSTEISLLATTEDGCEAFASIFIKVIPSRDIFVPNSFSPNNDKLNDYFTVFARNGRVAEIKSMLIYNRWGDQIFNKVHFPPNLEDQGWDGTHQGEFINPDVFIYIIEVEFIDGSINLFSGDLTLIK